MASVDSSWPASPAVRRALLVAVLASALYGTSYPLLRHFDIRQPGGSSDARSYVAMSHGDWNVTPVRRYRPLVPALAAAVRPALRPLVSDAGKLDDLSFYVVNFAFGIATALLLHATLSRLGFSWSLALVGSLLFVTSRVTTASVGTPMVDSAYFLAVGIVLHLTLAGRDGRLAVTMPFLVLAKETVLPFLLVPFFRRNTRTWRVFLSIGVAAASMALLRAIVDRAAGPDVVHVALPGIVGRLSGANGPGWLGRVFSLAGIHDLLHGFGLLLPLAAVGWGLDRRSPSPRIPGFLLLPVPIALAFTIPSTNMGRMLFAAYVPVIAGVLVVVERALPARADAAPDGDATP